jgi:hypothetical protein
MNLKDEQKKQIWQMVSDAGGALLEVVESWQPEAEDPERFFSERPPRDMPIGTLVACFEPGKGIYFARTACVPYELTSGELWVQLRRFGAVPLLRLWLVERARGHRKAAAP